jgi:Domain of unknown function (DUF4406)
MGDEVRYYLAGGMSGYPMSNFPAFYAAASDLRARGYEIISPAELDDADTVHRAMNNMPSKQSWGDFLARDVKIVADKVQGIVFLPDWHKSRGAKLEAFVGLLQKDFEFFAYKGEALELDPVDREDVLGAIYLEMI